MRTSRAQPARTAPTAALGAARQRRRWGWRAGAALAGVAPAAAFPEAGVAALAYLGLVPLLLLIAAAGSGREAAARGWLGGVAFLAGVHAWLAPVTGPLLLVAVGLVGVAGAGWGALSWALLRWARSPGRVVVAAAGVAGGWVLLEVARSAEVLGGPFGLLGSSQWATPWMLAPAALGGVWLVSFLAVAVNAGLAVALRPGGGRPGRVRAAGLAVAVVAAGAGPVWQALRPDLRVVGQARVGVVQVGVVHGPQARFALGERLTTRLAGSGVELVVWGESSVGADLATEPGLARRVAALARRLEAPVLVNTDARRAGGEGIFKSTVVVGPDGPTGARYDKQRLVPFGEYIPLRGVLGWLAEVTDAAEVDRRRGDGLRLLQVSGLRLGPLVCFETAFPDMSRQLAAGGAQLLVGQSSTSTFQDSWAPEQHASLAAVRAVETGRPVVHATLSGVSAVVDHTGRVRLWSPTTRRGAWAVTVPITAGTTPYVQLGPWVPLACALLLALLALGAASAPAGHPERHAGTRPRPHPRSQPDPQSQVETGNASGSGTGTSPGTAGVRPGRRVSTRR